MKLLILAILLSCLALVSATGKYSHKKNHKKLHSKHRQTPKAFDLNNHFGYSSVDSPYGPRHNNLIVVNTIPSPEVVPQCVISVQPYYDLCSPFATCGSCAASPYCGWCSALQQCLPGNFDSCSCSDLCINNWYFSVQYCPRLFVTQRVNLVSPEIAKPKVHVISEQAGIVKETQLIGNEESHNIMTTVDDFNGEVVRHDITTQKPIYGSVEKPIRVIKHDIVNLDGTTQSPDVVKYHGMD